jgi:hypothetical protein
LLDALDRLQPAVRRNPADFAAFRLTVAYLAHLYWRQATVGGLSGDTLQAVLAEVAWRDAALADQLAADWQATRDGNPLAGYAHLATWGFGPEDWLHGRFLAAARFTAVFAPVTYNADPTDRRIAFNAAQDIQSDLYVVEVDP